MYATRDLLALLENHSPLRQIYGGLSPGLTDVGETGSDDEKRDAPDSIEPGNASFSNSGGDGGELNSRPPAPYTSPSKRSN